MSIRKSHLVYLLAYVLFFTLDLPQHLIPDQQTAFLAQLYTYPPFALWGAYLFRKDLREGWRKLSSKPLSSLKAFLLSCLGMLVVTWIFTTSSDLLLAMLGDSDLLINDQRLAKVSILVSPVFVLPILGLLGPLVEELIFRKILQDFFSQRLSTWLTITLQALLFALIHSHQFSLGELVQVIPHFGYGLFFGWLKYRRDNLTLLVFLHAFNNHIGFLGLF